MYSTFAKSENQPLINNSNVGYGDTNSVKLSKERATPTYPWKLKVVVFALLVVTAIVVYSVFPRNNHIDFIAKHGAWVTLESAPQARQSPPNWRNEGECDDQEEFTLTFAVTLQNVEELDRHVMAVSDPASENYLQFWSPRQVKDYFAPADSSVQSVREWLSDAGIADHKVSNSEKSAVIRVETNCKEAGVLLNTKYHVWVHEKSGKRHLRVENGDYSIPGSIESHLDFVTPTFRFPFKKHQKSIEVLTNSEMVNLKSKKGSRKQKYIEKLNGNEVRNEETTVYNTPEEIKQLYGMEATMATILDGETSETMATYSSRQAIASFIEEYYEDSDLEMFWEYFELDPVSEMERYPSTQPEGYGSEAELDTQYITSTGSGVYTYVFYEDGSNIFVELATSILDEDTVPSVVSISYGADEYELGETYVTRCNTEFGKLALVGCSVTASSGDEGVLGNSDACYSGTIDDMLNEDSDSDTDMRKKEEREREGEAPAEGMPIEGDFPADDREDEYRVESSDYSYIASFPACALYVTAVGGATDGDYTSDSTSSASTGEKAWEDSGGGFSIYFTRATYQDKAVTEYFDSDDVTVNYARFADTGRAYPDVALQSIDYVIAYEGEFYSVSGTSCSSPTFAGMISLINFAREKDGKSNLGFLNPALYHFYYQSKLAESTTVYYNDVIEGYNEGCTVDDGKGFSATTGWDPVTGLGTTKFANLYTAFMAMD